MKQNQTEVQTDEELILRFQSARDENAFAELVRKYAPMVRATIRRCLDNEYDIDDAYQATFLAFIKNLGGLRSRASVAGWLHRAAHSAAIEVLRSKARQERHTEQIRSTMTSIYDDSHEDPDRQVLASELKLVLDEELAQLPEHFHEALVLCDLLGNKQNEVAMQLGISSSTLNERVAKGRDLLRRRLAKRGIGLSVGGMAAFVAISTRPVEAASTNELASLATEFLAGKTTASYTVLQLTNKVMTTMTSTKMVPVAILGLAMVMFAGSVLGLTGYTQSTVQAETLFLDDFNYASLSDSPVNWVPSPYNSADFDTSTGDLLITPNEQSQLDRAGLAVAAEDLVRENISIRARVRTQSPGDSAVIQARTLIPDVGEPTSGYFAAVTYLPDQGTVFALGVPNSLEATGDSTFFSTLTNEPFASLSFDIREQDAEIQLDLKGNRITAWAWPAGEERPSAPFFDVNDDTVIGAGVPSLSLTVMQPTADLSNHGATFRYVHLATESIPEPSAVCLAGMGLSAVLAVFARRKSKTLR